MQCLLRDSLQQIESVELPRGGNLGWGGKTVAPALTICRYRRAWQLIFVHANLSCSLSFTATGNCLVVIDSLGQLYLYSMSPIADPGGPSSAPFTVQVSVLQQNISHNINVCRPWSTVWCLARIGGTWQLLSSLLQSWKL